MGMKIKEIYVCDKCGKESNEPYRHYIKHNLGLGLVTETELCFCDDCYLEVYKGLQYLLKTKIVNCLEKEMSEEFMKIMRDFSKQCGNYIDLAPKAT